MSEKKRVMIIAHFCDYGDEQSNNRFNYIAQMLTDHGFEVELVTSSFSHRQKKQRKRVEDLPYKTTLIYEPSYQNNISLKRLLYSHRIMARNLRAYLKTAEKPDVVYCAIPSVQVAEAAAEYAQRNNIRFIIDVQDLWPEAFQMAFNIPVLSDVMFLPFKKLANRAYASADAVIAVSQTYVERAKSVNKRIKNGVPIFIGTDLDTFDDNARQHKVSREADGSYWIAYCGSLSDSYDIPCVIDALKKLDRPDLKLIVMGDGHLGPKFKEYALQSGINCTFTGRLNYPEMCGILKSCDIAVNPIKGKSAASIINKHADYAAAGLPVVNTQESAEYRDLLEHYKCGINCEVGVADQVAHAVLDLVENPKKREQMGIYSRKMAEERFDRKHTYQEIIDEITAQDYVAISDK